MTLSSDASSMLTITLTEKPQHEGASVNVQPDPFPLPQNARANLSIRVIKHSRADPLKRDA